MSSQDYWNNQQPPYGYAENQQEGRWPQNYQSPDQGSGAAQPDYSQPYGSYQHQYGSPPPGNYQRPYQHQPYGYGDNSSPSSYPPQPAGQYEPYNQPYSPRPPPSPGPPPYNHVPESQSYYQGPPSESALNDPRPAEGEKGVLGALAGGALGAYGGHQVHHGFLGAVGGAVAGSKLEDHFKDKKKKEKKSHKFGFSRRDSSSSSSSSSDSSDDEKKKLKKYGAGAAAVGAGGAALYHHHQQQQPLRPPPQPLVLAGNFSASSTSITLDHDYDLIAACRTVHGDSKLSSISLNSVLTNDHGMFRWAKGGNFGASARNVRLVEGGRVLEAELGTGGGRWSRAWIRLDERITNDNGELRYLE